MLTYTRDVPRGDSEAFEAEYRHVVAHLSAVASEDDDPKTSADDVTIIVTTHPDDPEQVRITGTLDAEACADYLLDDFDPFADVDPELVREVLGGSV